MSGKNKKDQSKNRRREKGQAALGTVDEYEYDFFLAPDEEGEKERVPAVDLKHKKQNKQNKTMTFFLSN